jgi:hypothetical protein
MTVAELIEILKTHDPNLAVTASDHRRRDCFVSKDSIYIDARNNDHIFISGDFRKQCYS